MKRKHTVDHSRFESEQDEFDDEFNLEELVDDVTPKEAKHLLHATKPFVDTVVEQVLPKGVVSISQEIGTRRALVSALRAIHSHFDSSDFSYRKISSDTFKLRIRARSNPLYGSYTGKVTIREHLDPVLTARSGVRTYHVEGILRYRMSITWLICVIAFFAIILTTTGAGKLVGWVLFIVGVGITVGLTYRIGRDERDNVDERVAESFLRLRSTIDSL